MRSELFGPEELHTSEDQVSGEGGEGEGGEKMRWRDRVKVGGGGKRGGVTEEHLPQRAHLLERTEQLQKSSDRLEEGIRIARETEEIGMDVMDTLQRDRETIQRMRGRVRRGEEGGRGRRGRRGEERGGEVPIGQCRRFGTRTS